MVTLREGRLQKARSEAEEEKMQARKAARRRDEDRAMGEMEESAEDEQLKENVSLASLQKKSTLVKSPPEVKNRGADKRGVGLGAPRSGPRRSVAV